VSPPGLTVPRKLHRGDTLRVVAPARSRPFVAEHDHSTVIDARFAALGLRLTFGDHVDERDDFESSPVASRVSDLHAAFADPEVAGILTVIGGFNSNQLLPHLDWDLIAAHPKIFCGYSAITALQNAILARAGLVTYSGPHWSSFGMRDWPACTRQRRLRPHQPARHLPDRRPGGSDCRRHQLPAHLRLVKTGGQAGRRA
jgi:muramoyltetrapeptide carboxypeptidase LdcA involved in peptidoglycan recycling